METRESTAHALFGHSWRQRIPLAAIATALIAVGLASPAASAAGPGGPFWPFTTKSATQYDRVDEGWDIQYNSGGSTNAGGVVVAIAAGTIQQAPNDAGGFGDNYPYEVLDQQFAGTPTDTVYYGHVHVRPSVVGKHVSAGTVIADTNNIECSNNDTLGNCNYSAAPAGWLEIGFANHASGAPAAGGCNPSGSNDCVPTQDGTTMHDLLTSAPVYAGVQSPGRSTGGLARFGNGAWTFYRSNAAPAPAQHAVAATDEYGTWSGTAATDVPLVGDWQGTGKDSPGLARFANGTWTFYLSNTAPAPGQHTNAATDEYVTWSGTAATDVPLVGDWQGTGKDSPGLARFANGTWTFYLSNTAPAPGQHTNAATDEYVTWSGTAATDVPLVGDWQGTGKDSPGLARFANGTWTFYRSNAAPAPAQHAVAATDEYVTWSGTAATDTPMVGDWQGTGKDSPGLARFSSGTWTFYRSNAAPSPGQHASATTDQYVTWAGTAATDITQTGHWN